MINKIKVLRLAGIDPGSIAWKAAILTIKPQRSRMYTAIEILYHRRYTYNSVNIPFLIELLLLPWQQYPTQKAKNARI